MQHPSDSCFLFAFNANIVFTNIFLSTAAIHVITIDRTKFTEIPEECNLMKISLAE